MRERRGMARGYRGRCADGRLAAPDGYRNVNGVLSFFGAATLSSTM